MRLLYPRSLAAFASSILLLLVGRTLLLAQGQPASHPPQTNTVGMSDYIELRRNAGRVRAADLPALQQKAATGDLPSQLLLAMLYQLGCGVIPRDLGQDQAWYHKAADQGSAIGENQIGIYYDKGGPGHDMAEAFKWYHKAADRNDAVAQYNLGDLYVRGTGVEQSLADAALWYRKAVENGYDHPLRGLTAIYHAGKALPGKSLEDNQKEGLALLQSLANQGNANAQFVLAEAYFSGWLGLQKDEQQALTWLRKAAEKDRRGILPWCRRAQE